MNSVVEHRQWAAFAVDEIDGVYDWRSVTVHGSVQLLLPDEAPAASSDFSTAVKLLRTVVPTVFTVDDPMPERVQMIRIHVDEIDGRESRSTGADALPTERLCAAASTKSTRPSRSSGRNARDLAAVIAECGPRHDD